LHLAATYPCHRPEFPATLVSEPKESARIELIVRDGRGGHRHRQALGSGGLRGSYKWPKGHNQLSRRTDPQIRHALGNTTSCFFCHILQFWTFVGSMPLDGMVADTGVAGSTPIGSSSSKFM